MVRTRRNRAHGMLAARVEGDAEGVRVWEEGGGISDLLHPNFEQLQHPHSLVPLEGCTTITLRATIDN